MSGSIFFPLHTIEKKHIVYIFLYNNFYFIFALFFNVVKRTLVTCNKMCDPIRLTPMLNIKTLLYHYLSSITLSWEMSRWLQNNQLIQSNRNKNILLQKIFLFDSPLKSIVIGFYRLTKAVYIKLYYLEKISVYITYRISAPEILIYNLKLRQGHKW